MYKKACFLCTHKIAIFLYNNKNFGFGFGFRPDSDSEFGRIRIRRSAGFGFGVRPDSDSEFGRIRTMVEIAPTDKLAMVPTRKVESCFGNAVRRHRKHWKTMRN